MDARTTILPVLRRLHDVTIGDVTQATGLPAPTVGDTLWSLVAELHGYVDVAQGGDVLFRFPIATPQHSELWRAFWKSAYGVLKAVYKVGITVVLVLYFVVFVIIAVAALLSAASEGSSNSSSSSWDTRSDLDLFGWLAWNSNSSSRAVGTPASFDRWDRSRTMSSYGEPDRSVPEKVFAFVFGEEEPPPDPHRADELAVAYVREHQGYITATEMLALRGGTMAEAARDVAHLAYQNGGGVEITEHGTFLYQMRDLVPTARQPKDKVHAYWQKATGSSSGVPWCWDVQEPMVPFNDNTGGFNLTVGCVNAFNLFWSGALTFQPHLFAPLFALPGWADVALGPIPFVFSLLFFVIPILRSLWNAAENDRRKARNAWRGLLHRLFLQHVWAKTEQPVTVQVLAGGAPEPAEKAFWESSLARAVDLLNAREDDKGFIFERQRSDLAEVEKARQGQTEVRTTLGPIVHSTQNAPTLFGDTEGLQPA